MLPSILFWIRAACNQPMQQQARKPARRRVKNNCSVCFHCFFGQKQQQRANTSGGRLTDDDQTQADAGSRVTSKSHHGYTNLQLRLLAIPYSRVLVYVPVQSIDRSVPGFGFLRHELASVLSSRGGRIDGSTVSLPPVELVRTRTLDEYDTVRLWYGGPFVLTRQLTRSFTNGMVGGFLAFCPPSSVYYGICGGDLAARTVSSPDTQKVSRE